LQLAIELPQDIKSQVADIIGILSKELLLIRARSRLTGFRFSGDRYGIAGFIDRYMRIPAALSDYDNGGNPL
jgi:hypothetical protein